jgi:hypothetical protein
MSTATGKTVRYVNVPPAVAKGTQLAAGMPPYLADALEELFAGRRAGSESIVYQTIPELLGRRATSFAEFAARNAAMFRGDPPPTKA